MAYGFAKSGHIINPVSFYNLVGNVAGGGGSGSVTSVGLSGSSAFSIVGSPITSSGVMTISGAGTSAQYIDGTGALQTFPSLAGYVPTSRTLTINNTVYDLSANRVWSIAPSGTTGQILAKNSSTDFDFGWIDNYTELLYDTVKANTAINKGQAVYISGANGTNQLAGLADNSTEATSSKTLGLALQNMALNAIGPIVTQGLISGIDTSAAVAGDPVWLGTNGNLIFGLANKPVAPKHLVYIGVVTRAHAVNGEIYVRPQNGFELEELHNVLISGVTNNDILAYESATSLWKNKSIPTVLGYTPVPTTRTLTINGTAYDLSADRSWSITAGVSSVSASLPLSSSGGATPNITIAQANTSTNGYLSSTDWNTFNSKQATISLTTTGSSGSATFLSNTLNVPTYTLAGLGGQPLNTNLTSLAGLTYASTSFVKMTAAGTFALDTSTYYLASNPNGYTNNTGTVTSVAALTLGTSGTDLSSTVANGTTTPVITLNIPTASSTNRGVLSSADWSTFNNKQNAITLTTTGNSGAATLVGSTLNIPNHTIDGLLPSQTGNSGKYLTTNGTSSSWATVSGGMTNPMTTLGDIIYEDATPTPARLAGNTTTTQKFLGQVGNGTISAAPIWFDLFGTANTWTALQTFNPSVTASGGVARTIYLTSTLTAAANNDVLVALDINPTFTPGTYTGVTQMYIRTPTTYSSTNKGCVFIGGNGAAGGTDLSTSPDLWLAYNSTGYTYMNFLSSSTPLFGTIWYGTTGTYKGFYFTINGTSTTTGIYSQKFAFTHGGRVAYIGQEADTTHSYSAPTYNNFYLRMSANNDNTRYFKIFTDNASAAQTERFGIQGFANSAKAYFNNVLGVGFNVVSPTALVHIGASTTAVASLRIVSGVAPTTPNDGDIWYDGTNIKMRVGATTKTFTLV